MNTWPWITTLAVVVAVASIVSGLWIARRQSPDRKHLFSRVVFPLFWSVPMALLGLVDLPRLADGGGVRIRLTVGYLLCAVMLAGLAIYNLRLSRKQHP